MFNAFPHIIPASAAPAWSFRFADPWPAWWLITAGLAVLAYLVYRRESGTATRRQKLFLATLRAAALLLVMGMIFRPVRVSELFHTTDSVLVMMVDSSLSMGIRDEYRDPAYEAALASAVGIAAGDAQSLTPEQKAQLNLLDRRGIVAKILENSGGNLLQELRAKCTPRLYAFSSELRPMQWPGEGQQYEPLLKPEGRTTAIGECIREAARELKGQRIAGMVIITDGQSNAGRDAVAAAEEYALNREEPFPIFAVGVGDPSEPKDVEVLQIFGNSTVFAKDSVSFTVAISSQGFAGRRATLTIKAGETTLATRQFDLKDGQLQQVPIRFKPEQAGKYECRAIVEPLADELTDHNNQSPPHLLEVIDRPIQVLLVSEKPTWEYRYLKNYLVRDTSVKVSCLLQSADPDFFQEGTLPISEFPKSREDLFKYDVIILLGANPARFTDADLASIQGFVENVGGGLLVSAQEEYQPSLYTNTPIEKLLPVVPGPPLYYDPLREKPTITQSFGPVLTPAGMQHPVMALNPDDEQNGNLWKALPGTFWYYPPMKLKPGAVSLLEHPAEGNDTGKYPLIAVQFYRGARTMYVGFDSTWRWRFMVGDVHFGRFWGQAIRFLSSGRLLGENKRLNVATDKSTYVLGQKVVVQARSLDRFYEPLKADELPSNVASDEFKEKPLALKAVPGNPGMFRGEFTPASPGKYTVTIRSGSGATAAESTASLVVRMPDLEYDKPGMNADLLRKVAKVSGGNYFPIHQISKIPDELEKLREEYTSEEQHDIWDSPWLLAVFAALVIVEWSVRKRKMMA